MYLRRGKRRLQSHRVCSSALGAWAVPAIPWIHTGFCFLPLTNKAKNTSTLVEEEGRAGVPASANICRSKQAVPENAVNKTLGPWVGLSVMGSPSVDLGHSFFPRSQFRGSGLEGKGQARAALTSDSRVRDLSPSPFSQPQTIQITAFPVLLRSQLSPVVSKHSSPGKDPRISLKNLRKRETKGMRKGGAPGLPPGQACCHLRMCQNSSPHPPRVQFGSCGLLGHLGLLMMPETVSLGSFPQS